MKQLFIVLFALTGFSYFHCQGQTPTNVSIEAYKMVAGLKLIESISADKLPTEINLQAGSYLWYTLRLKADKTYSLISTDCLSENILDNGTWDISSHRMLALNSKKSRTIFDILKKGDIYYFVKPAQRKQFLQDIKDGKALGLNYYSAGAVVVK